MEYPGTNCEACQAQGGPRCIKDECPFGMVHLMFENYEVVRLWNQIDQLGWALIKDVRTWEVTEDEMELMLQKFEIIEEFRRKSENIKQEKVEAPK